MTDRLFQRLKAGAPEAWSAFTHHDFVAGLGKGSLPEAAFRHYLVQDWKFLLHFARAYALAIVKSQDVAEMRKTLGTVDLLLNMEMQLHEGICASWGISTAELAAAPEASWNMAYTRFVLERGFAGDLLELKVALAPCIIGYAEIGARLAADPTTLWDGNPYRPWLKTYADPVFQQAAVVSVAELDRLWAESGNEGRLPALQRTFEQATRLEAAFWQGGLTLAL